MARGYAFQGTSGMREIMSNLNKEIRKIKGSTMAGAIKCAILIRRDTENTSPVTPVDLGNLRSSWFVVTAQGEPPTVSVPPLGRLPKTASEKRRTEEVKKSRITLVSALQARAASVKTRQYLYMGYAANYAYFVHEKLGDDINWQRKGSGAKWFEYSLKRNSKEMLKIIAQNAKIK